MVWACIDGFATSDCHPCLALVVGPNFEAFQEKATSSCGQGDRDEDWLELAALQLLQTRGGHRPPDFGPNRLARLDMSGNRKQWDAPT